MRYAFVLGIFLFVLPTVLFAETRYVSEIRQITLRTGPGGEYIVIAEPKTGTPVTVLGESEAWTQVQLADGKEGWLLTQYLTAKVPDTIQLKSLRKKHDTLIAETDTLKNENQGLKEKVATLTTDLDSCRSEYDTLNSTHETLKTESADFLELQASHKSAVKELAAQKEKADRLEEELSGLINDQRLKWFLLGAGVLLLGIIIGFITKPQRRRSSLL